MKPLRSTYIDEGGKLLMTRYREMITVSVNKALKKKLLKEAKGTSKREADNLYSNIRSIHKEAPPC